MKTSFRADNPLSFVKKETAKFDPDRLALSKDDILDFCDRVLEKWSHDPSDNAQNIVAMNAVRTSVYWTDEESLKAIWGEILNWTFELMYKNAIAQAREEKKEWSPILEKITKEKSKEPGAWF